MSASAKIRSADARRGWLRMAVLLLGFLCGISSEQAVGQSSVRSTSLRPFVTGLIPVVGRGGFVGGVSVDAKGIVGRSSVDELGRLRAARLDASRPIDSVIGSRSSLRKLSLRGLQAAIETKHRGGEPVTEELQYLAGLQRVQYVFIYPEQNDIVIAGFAEGWRIDETGNVVGQTSGQPVLQLDDLLVALRTAENAATGSGISCSMDPTEEGTRALQRLLATRGLQMNTATVARMEKTLGNQVITITGVPRESRFAHVLVAADFVLKRIGMNFEPAPVAGLPSYLELLRAESAPVQRNAMPRFWMAPRYDPLLRDPDGLGWEIRGSGVQCFADDESGSRTSTESRQKSTLATQWAETFTSRYDELAASVPVFAELRNCIDLAVVGALLAKEELPRRAECDLSILLDSSQVQTARLHVPTAVASRASVVPKGRQWIVSVSGGIELDSWSVLERVELDRAVSVRREKARPNEVNRWWWD